MTTLQKGLITVAIVTGIVIPFVIQQQARVKLRQENEALRQQITQLKAGNENLSGLATQSNKPASLPVDQFNELLRLRGEAGVYRAQTADLARLRQENQNLLSKIAAQVDPTNQLSAQDQLILRQTHAVDAMAILLAAVKGYATNHNGHYPESLEQLTASGDLGTTNFAGNLGLDDFELRKDGWVDPEGDKVILSLRVPIRSPGRQSVVVDGAINKAGVAHTTIGVVSP